MSSTPSKFPADDYAIHHPEQIFSPGMVIFRPIVEKNLETMIAMAGGVSRLRPHCKTHKIPEISKMQLDRGITKHKAATFAEAEMLAEVGVPDIFLAYNMVGPNIQRAVRFRQKYPQVTFSVTADDPQLIRELGAAMIAGATSIDVVLDVNPGRDRTGRNADDEGFAVYQLIAETPGLNPAGLHLYDGHLRDAELAARAASVAQYWETISAFRERLLAAGLPVPKIVCGGTPTFPVYSKMDDPTIELSPGTCTFHDINYGELFPDLEVFQPAALMLTRVISRPTANRVTFDLGTKAVASDPPMGQRVKFPAIPDAVQVLQNEEHFVVETALAEQFQPGDWTLAIPRHVCPTSALHRSVTVIENGEIVDEWQVIARDRCLTI